MQDKWDRGEVLQTNKKSSITENSKAINKHTFLEIDGKENIYDPIVQYLKEIRNFADKWQY